MQAKLFIRYSAFSVALFSLFLSNLFAEERVAPQLRVQKAEYNFGTVSEGTKVVHEFPMQNIGTGDLHLQRIIPSCGCTAAVADGEIIKPGESGSIRVEFDTDGFSGAKTKIIRVMTNDIDNPISTLSLKGVVASDITTNPRQVSLGDVAQGVLHEQHLNTVTVQVREGSNIEIGSIETFSEYIQLFDVESSPTKKVFDIRLHPEAPIGEFRDRVIVHIKGGKKKSINIPVYANILGNLRLRPGTISFGILEGTELLKRSTRFENLGAESIAIKRVEADHPAVKASFHPIEDGKIYVVRVEVDPARVQGDLRASVRIVTSDEEREELSLSVYGILPPDLSRG